MQAERTAQLQRTIEFFTDIDGILAPPSRQSLSEWIIRGAYKLEPLSQGAQLNDFFELIHSRHTNANLLSVGCCRMAADDTPTHKGKSNSTGEIFGLADRWTFRFTPRSWIGHGRIGGCGFGTCHSPGLVPPTSRNGSRRRP